MGRRRQKTQLELAFDSESRGEAPTAESQGRELPASRSSSEPPGDVRLLESILARSNMQRALQRVTSNKGSPGVDGMTVEELPTFLRAHWPEVREQLKAMTYQPQPVRRVKIPKPGGGSRKLGIPISPPIVTWTHPPI